jgi:hypothetical protein
MPPKSRFALHTFGFVERVVFAPKAFRRISDFCVTSEAIPAVKR